MVLFHWLFDFFYVRPIELQSAGSFPGTPDVRRSGTVTPCHPLEDENDDEDEDDFVYANISSKNARMVAHERAAALAL